jgi:hypothetical protein
MSDLIQLQNVDSVEIEITEEAQELAQNTESALSSIGEINDSFEYTVTTMAVKKAKEFLRQLEESRKAAKAPFIEKGREIDAKAKAFQEPIEAQLKRVSHYVLGWEDYTRRERLKAEQAAREEMARIAAAMADKEKERIDVETIGRTGTLNQDLENIRESAAKEMVAVQNELAASPVALSKGLRRTKTVKFEVTDIAALHAARPDLFSPDETKIRAALKLTKDIPGLRVWEETKI